MIHIKTKTKWPLILNANVQILTSRGEVYNLTAHAGRMAFQLTGKGVNIDFRKSYISKKGIKQFFSNEYNASQDNEILLRIKTKSYLGVLGDSVFFENKWVSIPNVIKPYIKEYGLFCERTPLVLGCEVKAYCNNEKYILESLILVSYLWVRKWVRQD